MLVAEFTYDLNILESSSYAENRKCPEKRIDHRMMSCFQDHGVNLLTISRNKKNTTWQIKSKGARLFSVLILKIFSTE